jgi:hypothetical protein
MCLGSNQVERHAVFQSRATLSQQVQARLDRAQALTQIGNPGTDRRGWRPENRDRWLRCGRHRHRLSDCDAHVVGLGDRSRTRVVTRVDQTRHFAQARRGRGRQSAGTGHQVKAPLACADEQRLEYAVFRNRPDERLERARIDEDAIRVDLANRDRSQRRQRDAGGQLLYGMWLRAHAIARRQPFSL